LEQPKIDQNLKETRNENPGKLRGNVQFLPRNAVNALLGRELALFRDDYAASFVTSERAASLGCASTILIACQS
jgi:hypothetical protein